MNIKALDISEEEINSLKNYINESKTIDYIISDDINKELKLIDLDKFKYIDNDEDLDKIINQCELMYSVMVKNALKNPLNFKKLYINENKQSLNKQIHGFLKAHIKYEEESCSIIKFEKNLPYYEIDNNQILLCPYLNFEFIEIDNNTKNDYYSINVSRDNKEILNLNINNIITKRKKAIDSFKYLISNLNIIEQNNYQINELNKNMHNGTISRIDYPKTRSEINELQELNDNLKKQNIELKQIYIEFKSTLNLYLKNSFNLIEQNIITNFKQEKVEQNNFIEKENKKNYNIEREKIFSNIKKQIDIFLDNLKVYRSEISKLNKFNLDNNYPTIKIDINKIAIIIRDFYEELEILNNNELNNILIQFKSYNFEELFNRLLSNDKYHISKKISDEISCIYRNQKIVENNERISNLSKEKNKFKKFINKITGKEKENKKEINFLTNELNDLNMYSNYNFDYILSNLTQDNEINKILLEKINLCKEISNNISNQNINIDNIINIFNLNNSHQNKQTNKINYQYNMEYEKTRTI